MTGINKDRANPSTQMQPEELLTKLGLSKKETELFLFLYNRGESSVGRVFYHTGLNRTHIYNLARSLKQKGLLSVSRTEPILKYKAVSYDDLLSIVSSKQSKWSFLEKEFLLAKENFIPLSNFGGWSDKNRIYYGEKAVDEFLKILEKDVLERSFVLRGAVEFSEDGESGLWQEKLADRLLKITPSELREIDGVQGKVKEMIGIKERKKFFKSGMFCWLDKFCFLEKRDEEADFFCVLIENKTMSKLYFTLLKTLFVS